MRAVGLRRARFVAAVLGYACMFVMASLFMDAGWPIGRKLAFSLLLGAVGGFNIIEGRLAARAAMAEERRRWESEMIGKCRRWMAPEKEFTAEDLRAFLDDEKDRS